MVFIRILTFALLALHRDVWLLLRSSVSPGVMLLVTNSTPIICESP
jgi:hypothetical protein